LVWVINPESRTASVYRGDGTVSRLHQDDELSGEDVIQASAAGFARCSRQWLNPSSPGFSPRRPRQSERRESKPDTLNQSAPEVEVAKWPGTQELRLPPFTGSQ